MRHSRRTIIFREDDEGREVEIPVSITYSYHRARRGARDSLCGVRGAGPPLEPDEPEYVEILEAQRESGAEIELTDDERDEIANEIIEEIHEGPYHE